MTPLLTTTPILPAVMAAIQAAAAESPADFTVFLGRFHPVLLHVPIGLAVGLIAVEIRNLVCQSEGDSAAWTLSILFCATAIISTALGLALASEGGYDPDLLYSHQWSGIATAVLSLVVLALKWRHRRTRGTGVSAGYRASLLVCFVVMGWAGHKGGQLTHGSDYLFEYMPAGLASVFGYQKPVPPAHDTDDAFLTKIRPILADRCYSCHGPSKQKGDLRLDTRKGLFQTSDGEVVIAPGDAMRSLLVKVITLPEDHDDRMPPYGKPQLTPEEIVLLMDWINRGAKMPEQP